MGSATEGDGQPLRFERACRAVRVRIAFQPASVCVLVALALGPASLNAAEPVVGVLTLHGVGSQHPGSVFDAKLRTALQEKAGGSVRVVVKSVYYHGESCDRQVELWSEFDRLEDATPSSLDQKIIRRLMLVNVGDALAYANRSHDENSFYRTAQGKVQDAIDELEKELGGTGPVAVVAHSLGCKVIFDYLCDVQAGQGIWEGTESPSEFRKLNTLRLLITTGCSLPFHESSMSPSEQRFFRANGDFQWINFYDRDDLLGWPLRPLGGQFAEIVQDEERDKIGSTLTSHFRYWRDDDLNEEIACRILDLAQENAAPATTPSERTLAPLAE